MTAIQYPLKKVINYQGFEVVIIQFKAGEMINVRVNSNTPANSDVPFNVMKRVYDEGFVTVEFLLDQPLPV
jgi:hypothetical protein